MKVGDVVQLKSGGPLMVIVEVGNKDVVCFWHNLTGEGMKESFPFATLNIAQGG